MSRDLQGRPLGGRWADSYWTALLTEGQWPKTKLIDAISDLLDQLAAHKDFFHKIRSQGGKVEFFVGWFLNGQGGGVFSNHLLARMADLSIDLSLDIYPPDLAPVRCPCCGLPTLAERCAWELCDVCWWEDDGQDDATADEVWGGPNGKYSLSAARANFLSHGHMYNPGKGIEVVERPSRERSLLLSYVRHILDGQETIDVGKLRAMINADRKARRR